MGPKRIVYNTYLALLWNPFPISVIHMFLDYKMPFLLHCFSIPPFHHTPPEFSETLMFILIRLEINGEPGTDFARPIPAYFLKCVSAVYNLGVRTTQAAVRFVDILL